MLSKNVNNKKCAPTLIFFNEKKLRKIQIIFDIENWLWKSEISTFGQLISEFGKRYEIDLRVIFYQWPKLGLDVEAEIQILKVS